MCRPTVDTSPFSYPDRPDRKKVSCHWLSEAAVRPDGDGDPLAPEWPDDPDPSPVHQVYWLNSGSSHLCSKPPGENSYKPHMLWKYSSLASILSWTVKAVLIQSRTASSESINICTSSVQPVKRALSWIGHSRSFKVMLICADRNPERCIVVMCL